MRDLHLSLLSRLSVVGSAAAGRALLDHIEALQPGWLPDRWDSEEPMRRRYDPANPDDEEMFKGYVIWRSRDGATGDAASPLSAWEPHGFLSIDADSTRADIAGATGLLKRLAADFEGQFGYIHILTEDDEAFLRGSDTDAYISDADGPWLAVSNVQLERCLPDLFWGTVLGPAYAELFGADRLASAPAYLVEEITPGAFYLQLSERIEDVHERPEELNKARAAIKEHLGADAFWNPALGVDYPYEAPRFASSPHAPPPVERAWDE